LADVERDVGFDSPDGISGCESFFDHIHLNAQRRYFAARSIAKSLDACIQQRFPEARDGVVPYLNVEYCWRRMAFSAVDRLWENDFLSDVMSGSGGRLAEGLRMTRDGILNGMEDRSEHEIVAAACVHALRENSRDLFVRRRLVNALRCLDRQREADDQAEILIDPFPFHWCGRDAL